MTALFCADVAACPECREGKHVNCHSVSWCNRHDGLEGCPCHARDHKTVAEVFAERKTCPDGGTCHHGCVERCWRVTGAGPLSGVYPDDRWPSEVRAEHTDNHYREVRPDGSRILDAKDERKPVEPWETPPPNPAVGQGWAGPYGPAVWTGEAWIATNIAAYYDGPRFTTPAGAVTAADTEPSEVSMVDSPGEDYAEPYIGDPYDERDAVRPRTVRDPLSDRFGIVASVGSHTPRAAQERIMNSLVAEMFGQAPQQADPRVDAAATILAAVYPIATARPDLWPAIRDDVLTALRQLGVGDDVVTAALPLARGVAVAWGL